MLYERCCCVTIVDKHCSNSAIWKWGYLRWNDLLVKALEICACLSLTFGKWVTDFAISLKWVYEWNARSQRRHILDSHFSLIWRWKGTLMNCIKKVKPSEADLGYASGMECRFLNWIILFFWDKHLRRWMNWKSAWKIIPTELWQDNRVHVLLALPFLLQK